MILQLMGCSRFTTAHQFVFGLEEVSHFSVNYSYNILFKYQLKKSS
ncbi:protein of unknown function [Xenorhabdus doucetiae]|uniref:Uncharacterized protein n=1 Tax=Xenorhabdus doucetiae TaxID=351671 RepID=A0A068QT55_9GAMM|nr:protein of unknown function [Xenorhabdus doucetiae]